jgi:hypothetical protein
LELLLAAGFLAPAAADVGAVALILFAVFSAVCAVVLGAVGALDLMANLRFNNSRISLPAFVCGELATLTLSLADAAVSRGVIGVAGSVLSLSFFFFVFTVVNSVDAVAADADNADALLEWVDEEADDDLGGFSMWDFTLLANLRTRTDT